MAPRGLGLTWSPEAKRDLEQVYRYIAAADRPAARRLVTKIRAAVNGLLAHPEIGRSVPEFENTILRERLVGQYRFIYTYSHDRIEIAAIWHAAEFLGG